MLGRKDPHKVLITILMVSSVVLLFELTRMPWVAVVVYLVIDSLCEGA